MGWFHVGASGAIDRIGQELRAQAKRSGSNEAQGGGGFQPEWPSSVVLTEADIVGGIEGWNFDLEGLVVERFFHKVNRAVFLRKNGCDTLDQLIETTLKSPGVSSSVTEDFLVRAALEWLWEIDGDVDPVQTLLSDWLDAAITREVKEHEVLIPIAGLSIAHAFQFGPTTLIPLTEERVSMWLTRLATGLKNSEVPKVERLRRDLQGFAAVQVRVSGTTSAAMRQALETAALVTMILRVFHPASACPAKRIICAPLGLEYQPGEVGYFEEEGVLVHRISRLRSSEPGFVKLSGEVIAGLHREGLSEASDLLFAVQRSDFGSRVLRAAEVYSRVATEYWQSDKLVFLLSSLETLLLRNESEPIQQNLGERLAFFIMKDPTERKRIVHLVREAYKLRSRYLHHGLERFSLVAVKDLFTYAWLFFNRVIKSHKRWETAEELFSSLDEEKFG